jgi:hypothetical protein
MDHTPHALRLLLHCVFFISSFLQEKLQLQQEKVALAVRP